MRGYSDANDGREGLVLVAVLHCTGNMGRRERSKLVVVIRLDMQMKEDGGLWPMQRSNQWMWLERVRTSECREMNGRR